MIILFYVIFFTYCYYIYHLTIKMNRRNELPQELNKLGNEIIFFSLDKDDANPYHSTISRIECKKKTLYPDYTVDDIDEGEEDIDDKEIYYNI